jgi:arylsulfatase A-like enzyme
MADDMGYGDAGCYGQEHILTPNIDRLATQGMRFTQCYAGSTVCAPSRSVLMTGLHVGHTRVRGNFGVGGVQGLGGGKGRIPLKDEDLTVAETLKEAGYITGIMGKWGLGEPNTSGTPNRQGFDTWFGYLNQRRAHSFYPEFLWFNEDRFSLPGNLNEENLQYSHDLMTGFATHFIRKNHDSPFFLYLPFTIPHSKFQVPDLGPYADKPWPIQAKTYAAMISRMDRDIGTILDLIDELNLANNTIVFFCSDNGAADRYDGLFNSSGPLRGRKRDLYEGGLRTPMLVRWPGKIAPESVNDTPWSFADFLPTAAAIAKTTTPINLDGDNILPTLLGETQDLGDRFLYWEFFEKGFQQAARWRDWKAIIPSLNAPIQLYHLEPDLGESNDVSGQFPEIIERFKQFFATARTDSVEFPVKPTK